MICSVGPEGTFTGGDEESSVERNDSKSDSSQVTFCDFPFSEVNYIIIKVLKWERLF